MIAHDENSAITVTLKNPSTYPVSPLTTAHITSGFVMLINSFEELPSILPGGKATYSWPIVPADAAYKTLILARVFVESSYPNPSRTGSCGVYVLPFGGIPGRAVATLLLIPCLAGMSLGLYFWRGKGALSSRRFQSLRRDACAGRADNRWIALHSHRILAARAGQPDPGAAHCHCPGYPLLGRDLIPLCTFLDTPDKSR